MIDKNKLIDALYEACEKDSFKELPSWVINVINKQPEDDRWIPVSERLPEEDGSYLVSGVWGSGKKFVGDCEFSVSDGYFDVYWNFNVLAWQPLPKPYEG